MVTTSDKPLCQYCDTPRTHLGYFGNMPVSLCTKHKEMHGRDFDRVVVDTQEQR